MNGPEFKVRAFDIRCTDIHQEVIRKGQPLTVKKSEDIELHYDIFHCGQKVGLMDFVDVGIPDLWWITAGSDWTKDKKVQDVTFRAYPFKTCGCVENFGGYAIRWCKAHEPAEVPVVKCGHGYPSGDCSKCEQGYNELVREEENEYRAMTRTDY